MKRVARTALTLGVMLCPALANAAWDAVIDWAQRTELSTATSGVVAEVKVNAGERVAKGATLLRLDQEALRARVAQGKAALEHSRQLRDEAGRELERAEELYARTLLADHDLNLAKLGYAEADATYQRSRADYQQAIEALQNSRLQAPFDAIVIARQIEPSETVVTRLRAEPLLVVAAAERRLARFSVEAGELAGLSPGTRVRVELEGQSHEGVVESLMLDTPAGGSRFEVAVVFSTDLSALPGTAVRVTLP